MAKKIYVTRAQKNAAQWMVDRATAQGRPISEATRRIAAAQPEPHPAPQPNHSDARAS